MDDYDKAKELELTNKNRWEDGIDHHEMSERLIRFMEKHDLNDYNDSMDINVGGDGDNGEQLMYLMDAFFEMLDITNDSATKQIFDDNIIAKSNYCSACGGKIM